MLVIFDCDGVLVDSELLASEVFSSCLKAVDICLSAQDCYKTFRGHSLDYCKYWLEQRYSNLPKNFFQTLGVETEKKFSTHLRPVAGVEHILQRLRARELPFCVASNGGHKKIEHALEVTGLLQYFESARFSREDVKSGKPAPDVFLYAAETMGVPPAFTTVVEDSLAGVQAAEAAGMRVLAYQEQAPVALMPEHVEAFTHMSELERWLAL